jgi:hypothetical protein
MLYEGVDPYDELDPMAGVLNVTRQDHAVQVEEQRFVDGPFDGRVRGVPFEVDTLVLNAAFGAGNMHGPVIYTRQETFEPGVTAFFYAGPKMQEGDDEEVETLPNWLPF